MRHSRFVSALSLLAGLSLAGCATTSSGEATVDDAKTVEENRKATSEAEKKPAPAPEKATPTRSARESEERSAPVARDEKRADDANSPLRLIGQLNEATREIATLRAANAKLRAGLPATASSSPREPDPVDAKLAAGVKSYAQFKQELAGIFAENEKLRSENASLGAQVKEASSGSKDVKAAVAKLENELKTETAAVAKLENELKSEKAARAQAEQSVAKLRDQLRVVASALSGVEPATSGSESRTRSTTSSTGAGSSARRHVVKDGETLEKLADRYYGDPAKWRTILEANRDHLPLDGTLPSGLELTIPAR